MVTICVVVSLNNKKCYSESIDITNFNFGIGIAQHGKEEAKPCLESHYFFDTKICEKEAGFGLMVFLTENSENKVEGLGYGLLVGFKLSNRERPAPIKNNVDSFNIGVGWLKGQPNFIFSTTF